MNAEHYAVLVALVQNISDRARLASADEVPALVLEIDQLLRRSPYLHVNAALLGLRDTLLASMGSGPD